jgi:hypothetical protein
MSKHKSYFPGYWLPFMMLSLVPLVGYTADQPASSDNTANYHFFGKSLNPNYGKRYKTPHFDNDSSAEAPAEPSVQTAPVAQEQNNNSASAEAEVKPPFAGSGTSSVTSSDKMHHMSATEASQLFGGSLSIIPISDDGTRTEANAASAITIEGVIADACKDKLEIERVQISDTIGYTLRNNGGLQACMTANSCANEETPCTSLSQIAKEKNLIISLDRTKTVKVAYFKYNRLKGKLSNDAWRAESISGAQTIKSLSELDDERRAEEKRKAEEKEHAMLKDIMHCTSDANNFEEVMNLADELTAEDKDSVIAAMTKTMDLARAKEIEKFEEKVKAYLDQVAALDDVKKIDSLKLEQKAYDLAAEMDDLKDASDNSIQVPDAKRQDIIDNLAGAVERMAISRVTDTSANESSVTQAKAMLSRVLSSTRGLKVSESVRSRLTNILLFDMRKAGVQASYVAFQNARDKTGNSIQTMNAYKRFVNEENKALADLSKKENSLKCVITDRWGNVGSNPELTDNKTLADACSHLDNEIQGLKMIPQQAEQAEQKARQQAMQQQQQQAMARMSPQQQQAMRQAQQQQANQIVPPNTTFGPGAPVFGPNGAYPMNGGYPMLGAPGMQYAPQYAPTSPISGYPMLQPNPYYGFGGAGMVNMRY